MASLDNPAHIISLDTHLQIGSLLFEGLEEMELTGPFEALSRILIPFWRNNSLSPGLTNPRKAAASILLRPVIDTVMTESGKCSTKRPTEGIFQFPKLIVDKN